MRHLENLIDPFGPAEGAPPRTLPRFMAWLTKGPWPVLIVAALVSAASGGFEALTAWILGRIVDSADASGPEAFFTLANVLLLLGGVAFLLVLRPLTFGLATALNSIVIQPNVFALVLQRLNRWTLGQSVTFFDNDFAGRIAQKQMQTARAATDVAVEMINVVAFALASVIGAALLVTAIDWWLGVIFFAWMVMYLMLVRAFLPRIRRKAAARAASRARVSGQIVDTITNIKTVKLFAHADHEDQATLTALSGYRGAALEFGYLSTWFRLLLMIVAGTLPVLMVGASLAFWLNDVATVGDIVSSGTVAVRMAQMTGWVSFAMMQIYASVGEVEDGMHTLTHPVRLHDAEAATALRVPDGHIYYQDVAFSYGNEKGGVQGIELDIRPGEKLGIVGASGAGKSTLVALLLRLYDAESGKVLIDGQDIRGVTQDSLRSQIALVTQDAAMFNRSARENILYGRPDATEEEMVAAARKAEADHFIRDLVDSTGLTGYDARLGERGVKLSGGQRQRIALARAILKDAPILVLDEATSALDSEVEAQIQLALERVMEGKTVLAIAHRLSTISHMDRIAVLEAGRIVELGSHEALLAQNGVYARYWARQSGGFLNLDGDDGGVEAAE